MIFRRDGQKTLSEEVHKFAYGIDLTSVDWKLRIENCEAALLFLGQKYKLESDESIKKQISQDYQSTEGFLREARQNFADAQLISSEHERLSSEVDVYEAEFGFIKRLIGKFVNWRMSRM